MINIQHQNIQIINFFVWYFLKLPRLLTLRAEVGQRLYDKKSCPCWRKFWKLLFLQCLKKTNYTHTNPYTIRHCQFYCFVTFNQFSPRSFHSKEQVYFSLIHKQKLSCPHFYMRVNLLCSYCTKIFVIEFFLRIQNKMNLDWMAPKPQPKETT